MNIKQWLSLISLFLALLTFLDAVLPEKTQKYIVSKSDRLIEILESLKPRNAFSNISTKWGRICIELLSSSFYILSLYFIPEYFGYDVLQLRNIPTDNIHKASLFIINLLLDITPYPILGIGVIIILFTILKLNYFSDGDTDTSLANILGDGTFKSVLLKFISFVGGILFAALAYLVCYWFYHSDLVNDFFYWLPQWLAWPIGIIVIILMFYFLTVGIFAILVFSSNYWFALVLAIGINILEYSVQSFKISLRWFFSDPKRSYSIITALIALIIALGQFGADGFEDKSTPTPTVKTTTK